MIPASYIQEWSNKAPWPDSRQVEQDLIITRALCDLSNSPALKEKIAFRGGTVINKLLFCQPLRYSEDIDLVQTQPEPIGPTINAVRDALSWLGKCNRNQAKHFTRLVFRFTPEAEQVTAFRLKVEINTREHKNLYGIKRYPFEIDSSWRQAKTEILSFEPEELFGTKLRALLQRYKGRDLFDLHQGMEQLSMNLDKLIACFEFYTSMEGKQISRAVAEQRMLKKLSRSLTDDIAPLLPAGIRFNDEDAIDAFNHVWTELIARIKGDPWKLSEQLINELRNGKIPNLIP